MKLFDFWMQGLILMAFVVVSPFLFAILYPTSGDASLIWIWVVVVNSAASVISLAFFCLLNFVVAPEKTYMMKGLLPLALSSLLAYNIGSGMNLETEVPFLLGNVCLLTTLYLIYGLVFYDRIKSHRP